MNSIFTVNEASAEAFQQHLAASIPLHQLARAAGGFMHMRQIGARPFWLAEAIADLSLIDPTGLTLA